jgi:hypothetical protein
VLAVTTGPGPGVSSAGVAERRQVSSNDDTTRRHPLRRRPAARGPEVSSAGVVERRQVSSNDDTTRRHPSDADGQAHAVRGLVSRCRETATGVVERRHDPTTPS